MGIQYVNATSKFSTLQINEIIINIEPHIWRDEKHGIIYFPNNWGVSILYFNEDNLEVGILYNKQLAGVSQTPAIYNDGTINTDVKNNMTKNELYEMIKYLSSLD